MGVVAMGLGVNKFLGLADATHRIDDFSDLFLGPEPHDSHALRRLQVNRRDRVANDVVGLPEPPRNILKAKKFWHPLSPVNDSTIKRSGKMEP